MHDWKCYTQKMAHHRPMHLGLMEDLRHHQIQMLLLGPLQMEAEHTRMGRAPQMVDEFLSF